MKLCLQCNTHFQGDFEQCPDDGSKLVVVPEDQMIGKILGEKYRILNPIGKGSMGMVYRAVQESTGREMAVKVLHHFLGQNSDSVKRFHREARAVSRLSHPNIIRLYDFGVMEGGQPYIVTELLKGVTLSDVIRKRGYLELKQALPLFEQVCQAIGEAHRSRIIHRDLKPENIVIIDIDIEGDLDALDLIKKNSIRVLDFGVAKMWSESGASSASLTLEGKVCGSPAYMSPEQCRGVDVDFRTDIYSMGVVFFETLTGKRPFSADDLMALMLMHVNNQAPSLGAVNPEASYPPELNETIMKAMAKNPNERQQSAEELWDDVQATCIGRQKAVTVSQPELWIPFEGKGGIVLRASEDGQHIETSDSNVSIAQPVMLNWLNDDLPTPPKVKVKKENKKFLVFRALVIGLALIWGSAKIGSSFKDNDEARYASVLISKGKCQEGVVVLERLQKENKLASQYQDTLNDAYIQMSLAYAKSGSYPRAIEVLKKIPEKSRSYQNAQSYIKRYQSRLR
jgi:serine/threonine protein kinase